jgi:hypothetical protein
VRGDFCIVRNCSRFRHHESREFIRDRNARASLLAHEHPQSLLSHVEQVLPLFDLLYIGLLYMSCSNAIVRGERGECTEMSDVEKRLLIEDGESESDKDTQAHPAL